MGVFKERVGRPTKGREVAILIKRLLQFAKGILHVAELTLKSFNTLHVVKFVEETVCFENSFFRHASSKTENEEFVDVLLFFGNADFGPVASNKETLADIKDDIDLGFTNLSLQDVFNKVSKQRSSEMNITLKKRMCDQLVFIRQRFRLPQNWH